MAEWLKPTRTRLNERLIHLKPPENHELNIHHDAMCDDVGEILSWLEQLPLHPDLILIGNELHIGFETSIKDSTIRHALTLRLAGCHVAPILKHSGVCPDDIRADKGIQRLRAFIHLTYPWIDTEPPIKTCPHCGKSQ